MTSEEKAKIKSFKDLEAWKQAHSLVVSIYRSIERFPKEEKYGLAGQMRRAAVSIPSNIAEGFSRYSPKEKAQFYVIAQGSVTEVQSQLDIAHDIGYLDKKTYNQLSGDTVSVHKLINGLIKYVRRL